MPLDPDPPDFPNPPIMETLAVDAIGAHAATGPGHGAPVHTHCENCGTALQGPFCHRCGQHDFEFHRSFGHVFLEALENFFHFDAKLFTNIVTLLFQPGRLSAEFNAGKRAAQMPPFRLYLFVSVLFFFVSFVGSHEVGPEVPVDAWDKSEKAEALTEVRQGLARELHTLAETAQDPEAKNRLKSAAAQLDDLKNLSPSLTADDLRDVPAPLAGLIQKTLVDPATKTVNAPPPTRASALEAKVKAKENAELVRYLTEKGNYAMHHQEQLKEAFLHALPKMLLFCLPFMALYTRFLFRRSGQVYLQHLIVALHYHTFVYLWWLVARGWHELIALGAPGLAGLAGFLSGLWICLYPIIMLHRLYGQSWLRTFFKTVLLALTYWFTLAIGFLITAAIVFFSA